MLSDPNGLTARTLTRSSSPDSGEERFDAHDVHHAREVALAFWLRNNLGRPRQGKHMAGNNKHSVMALTRAVLAPNGQRLEIQLEVVGASPLVLAMSANSLGQIASALVELDSEAQIRIGSTTGHREVRAYEAHAVTAAEVAQGDKIVLSVRNGRGRTQNFALSLEQARQLREDMTKAEARARELASKSRN